MTIDLTPLYRHSVGYDRLAQLLDSTLRSEPVAPSYPPYNIEVVDDNRYAITLAVAGFGRDELELEVERGVLSVRGKKADQDGKRRFLHQGIAYRSFERKFNLAEHVEVSGAEFKDGLLNVGLVRRVPEAMKPRRIDIGTPSLTRESPKLEAGAKATAGDEAAA